MIGKEIRKLYEAAPFAPFRVHMANGKSVDIPHPEFMFISRTGRRMIVDMPDDTFEIIDLSLVTSVETLPKNGSRRARRRKSKR